MIHNFLDNYKALIFCFSYWENRKSYLVLIERFMKGKTNRNQFLSKFYQSYQRDESRIYGSLELLSKIETKDNFNLNEIENFADLIQEIWMNLDDFQPDSGFRENYEKSEKELKSYLEEVLAEKF